MSYGWELELPALSGLSDEAAAHAINAMTVPNTSPVFGSFRTLASVITQTEYNTLRTVLAGALAAEKAAGGFYLTDMISLLEIPGGADGNGGGLDFTNPSFIANVTALCNSAGITDVPAKIAAYVSSVAPPAHKYPQGAAPNQVFGARGA